MEEMKTRLKNGEIVFVLAARAGHMRAVRERFEYSGPRLVWLDTADRLRGRSKLNLVTYGPFLDHPDFENITTEIRRFKLVYPEGFFFMTLGG